MVIRFHIHDYLSELKQKGSLAGLIRVYELLNLKG
jgi:hypothetical protein